MWVAVFLCEWRSGALVRALDCDSTGREFDSRPFHCMSVNNLGQVLHTHMPLSPSSIIWYELHGSDVPRMGR